MEENKFKIIGMILFFAFIGKWLLSAVHLAGDVEHIFYWTTVGTVVLFIWAKESSPSEWKDVELQKHKNKDIERFWSFQRTYLTALLVSTFAEFTKDVHLYKVYTSSNLTVDQISLFYLVGFTSSLISGFFTGGIIDKYGRQRGVIIHLALNAFQSLITMMSNNSFSVLFVGSFVSGISMSFLATAYECWMISEHLSNGFPEDLIGSTFSSYVFGMGVIAGFSDVVSGFLAKDLGLGLFSPFALCCSISILNIVYVKTFWKENFGNTTESISANTKNACKAMLKTPIILLLALVQALFESVMFVFVFMWAPALRLSTDINLNLGLLFAALMFSMMSGASLYKILTSKCAKYSPQTILLTGIVIATICMLVGATRTDLSSLLHAFVAYVTAVGLYFSAIGTLRAEHFPEWSRATIMNISRVILNALVVGMLTGPVGCKTWSASHKKTIVFLLEAFGLVVAAIAIGITSFLILQKKNIKVYSSPTQELVEVGGLFPATDVL